MSAQASSITCTHDLGLNCRVCYDQRFGLDWGKTRKEMGLDDRATTLKLVGGPEPVPTPSVPYVHPFLQPLKLDE